MTEKDKKMIKEANRLHYADWPLVDDMEKQADSEVARAILHDICRNMCVKEKYSADFNAIER